MGIEDKVAIVTGASSGMGRPTAVLLAAKGARVMAVARREQRLEGTRRARRARSSSSRTYASREACVRGRGRDTPAPRTDRYPREQRGRKLWRRFAARGFLRRPGWIQWRSICTLRSY